jgi:hypothetical protein
VFTPVVNIAYFITLSRVHYSDVNDAKEGLQLSSLFDPADPGGRSRPDLTRHIEKVKSCLNLDLNSKKITRIER